MYLLEKYRAVKRWYQDIYNHREKVDICLSAEKIPFFTKLRYAVLGFTEQEYSYLELNRHEYRDYISYRERMRLEDVNGRFGALLGEKVMFERVFGASVAVPHIFWWVKAGSALGANGEGSVDVLACLKKHGEIILKPTRSAGSGAGVHKIAYKNGNCVFDNCEVDEDMLVARILQMEEHIAVQCVSQAAYSAEIFSGSVNTIRIVTVINEDRKGSDLILAFHRFGTKKTEPVDNMSSGGLFAMIDEETGEIGAAKSLLHKGIWFEQHPDNGAAIKGVLIPGWDAMVEALKRAHGSLPYYEFLAWDVAIDEAGQPWVLEINKGCDLHFQCIKPMRKEKLGRWMKKKGLLDNY